MSEKLIGPNLLVSALIICSQSDNYIRVVSGLFQLQCMHSSGKEKTETSRLPWQCDSPTCGDRGRRAECLLGHSVIFLLENDTRMVRNLCSAQPRRKRHFNGSASHKHCYELRCSPNCTLEPTFQFPFGRDM